MIMVEKNRAHRADAQADGDVANPHASAVGDLKEDQLFEKSFAVRDAQQNVDERDDQHR